jgi:hypothetical protein
LLGHGQLTHRKTIHRGGAQLAAVRRTSLCEHGALTMKARRAKRIKHRNHNLTSWIDTRNAANSTRAALDLTDYPRPR